MNGRVVTGQWGDELTDFARAATGGLLFGIPLLYTMEVWWTGQRMAPIHSLVVLAASLAVAIVLNHTAGFRRTRDVSLLDAAMDAVDAVALSLVLTAVVLVLLREVNGSTPLGVALGKVVYQAVPFSVGVGIARHFLAGGRNGEDDDTDAEGETLNATLVDVGATVLGALVVAAAIAPTDEIPMLDAQMDSQWVLALVGASLAVSYMVVFAAGFAGERQRHEQEGYLQHPLTETVVCYLVSLAVAAGLLWIFHRTEGSAGQTFTRTIILGLPASIGGAAGRLVG